MPELVQKRRTKRNDTSLANSQSKEEIYHYFASEEEWRLASHVYWDKRTTGLGSHLFFGGAYGVMTVSYYNQLLRKYHKFMNHKY